MQKNAIHGPKLNHNSSYVYVDEFSQTPRPYISAEKMPMPTLLRHLWWTIIAITTANTVHVYTECLKKTVQHCFCENFVKFPLILIIFGRIMAKRLELCEVHSFSSAHLGLICVSTGRRAHTSNTRHHHFPGATDIRLHISNTVVAEFAIQNTSDR